MWNEETGRPEEWLTSTSNDPDQQSSQEPSAEIQPLIEEAQAAMDEQRDQTSDALQSFADTIQEKAGALNGDHAVAEGASAQVERVADFAYQRDIGGTADRVQQYLQRQPLVGVASGIAVGFIIGKLWKR